MKSEVALHALVEPRSRSEVKSPPSLVHNRVTLPTDDLALNKGTACRLYFIAPLRFLSFYHQEVQCDLQLNRSREIL